MENGKWKTRRKQSTRRIAGWETKWKAKRLNSQERGIVRKRKEERGKDEHCTDRSNNNRQQLSIEETQKRHDEHNTTTNTGADTAARSKN
jgi:hypothetical protein